MTDFAVTIAQRLSVFVENARDMALDSSARGANGAALVKLLESRNERERVDGLRQVIGAMAKGQDMSSHFALVVKNVASASLEVRKLVYLYLIAYSESDPDMALMSVNTFQKALSDKSQIVRAFAMRVMSSIRVPSIAAIVLIGIRKSLSDLSPFVRQASTLAIPKCHRLDADRDEELRQLLETALADPSPLVVSAAISAHSELCPDRVDMFHPQFRRLCRMLLDLDEWAQCRLLSVMLVYCRTYFPDPSGVVTNRPPAPASGRTRALADADSDFYSDEASPVESHQSSHIDPDHELLLSSCLPLLQSRNTAVVMAAVALYHHTGPVADMSVVVEPLLKMLVTSTEQRCIVLQHIAVLALTRPDLFASAYGELFVDARDTRAVWEAKLEILGLIADKSNVEAILIELTYYTTIRLQPGLAAAAINAMGAAASRVPTVVDDCMSTLIDSMTLADDVQVVEAASAVVRRLVHADPARHVASLKQLISRFPLVTAPQARASLVWIFGEEISLVSAYAPDVLRTCAQSFASEEEMVKLAILEFAAKMQLLNELHRAAEVGRDDARGSSRPEIDSGAASRHFDGAEGVWTGAADGDSGSSSPAEQDGNREDRAPSPLVAENGYNPSNLGEDRHKQYHDQSQIPEGPDEPLRLDQTAERQRQPSELIPRLFQYIYDMARYDMSYSLRDRAVYYTALLDDPTSELTRNVVLVEKPGPTCATSAHSQSEFTLGSLSMLCKRPVPGYEALPPWRPRTELAPSSVRDVPSAFAPGPSAISSRASPVALSPSPTHRVAMAEQPPPQQYDVRAPVGLQSLDDFFRSSEDEEEEEEEEEGDEEDVTDEYGSDYEVEYVTDTDEEVSG